MRRLHTPWYWWPVYGALIGSPWCGAWIAPEADTTLLGFVAAAVSGYAARSLYEWSVLAEEKLGSDSTEPTPGLRGRRMTLPHALKSLWPWHWSEVEHTGVHVYETCQCGRRRIRKVAHAHQPIDRGWLETGEWTPRPTKFPQASSGVTPAR